jgi:hypothetical protein
MLRTFTRHVVEDDTRSGPFHAVFDHLRQNDV